MIRLGVCRGDRLLQSRRSLCHLLLYFKVWLALLHVLQVVLPNRKVRLRGIKITAQGCSLSNSRGTKGACFLPVENSLIGEAKN